MLSFYDRCLDNMKMYLGIHPYDNERNLNKNNEDFFKEIKRKYSKDKIERAYDECMRIKPRIEEFKRTFLTS